MKLNLRLRVAKGVAFYDDDGVRRMASQSSGRISNFSAFRKNSVLLVLKFEVEL